MKKMSYEKTCFGIGALISVLGFVGLIIAVILTFCVYVGFLQMLYAVTSSADVQPTGMAFFKSTGGWDYRRIALIEPYQAVSIDKKTWTVGLEKDKLSVRFQSLVDITNLKIDVIGKKVIVAYAPNTWLDGERVKEVWVVIIPEEDLEKAFTSEEEVLTYLKNRGINQPNLIDANELYKEYGDRGYLKWFPEELKE